MFLSLRISYRVRDTYAIKLTDRMRMSLLAGPKALGSNIAIRDGLLYGADVGDLTIGAYFQGEVSLPLETASSQWTKIA